MDKTFEGIFELFELQVRRLRNGNKLRLVFESAEDIETEKDLIEFRGETVKTIVTQKEQPKKREDVVTIEGSYEVFDLKCRRLRNGDKLQVILERMYEKDEELKAVRLRYEDCLINLESVEQSLDFEGEEEDGDNNLSLVE